MNKTIYKYPLVVTDFQEVLLPINSEIRFVFIAYNVLRLKEGGT